MVLFNLPKHTLETADPSGSVSVDSSFSPWLTPLAYPLANWVVLPFYFGHIQILGQEHLPIVGPVILAPTHRSRWDAIIVAHSTGRGVTGRDVRFMVSADEFKGIQGWLIPRLGGFPVNTKQPTIASLRRGVEVLKNREMLVIFPEGGIFRDTHVHPLRPGLARLAIQAESSQPGLDVQVVPISIQYSQPCPQWGCNVTLRIDKPLQVADYCQSNAKQDAQRLTADLEANLKRLGGQPHPHVLKGSHPMQDLTYALNAKDNLPTPQASRIQ
jgi:1-acyl-sn-glycerol-3-phosphate acyltransferase